MAKKTVQQGLSFFTATTEETKNSATDTYLDGMETKQSDSITESLTVSAQPEKRKQKNNRGPVWRANLFLDADLETYYALEARKQHKSISVFISEILREYMDNHK